MDHNDPDHPERRSDPFGMGLAAHDGALARDDCPFPTAYVEGRRWQAGWDQAEFREMPAAPQPNTRAPRERRWSPGELVVLAALVQSGEKMSNLASRLGRTKAAIREKCALQNLSLSHAQDHS